MAGPHQPERAATTDLPNQINNVCMYVCMYAGKVSYIAKLKLYSQLVTNQLRHSCPQKSFK